MPERHSVLLRQFNRSSCWLRLAWQTWLCFMWTLVGSYTNRKSSQRASPILNTVMQSLRY